MAITPKGPSLKKSSSGQVFDDLGLLLAVLPPNIKTAFEGQTDLSDMIEVVLDLGKTPEMLVKEFEMKRKADSTRVADSLSKTKKPKPRR